MLLVDLRQAGWLPLGEGGGQYEAPNSADVNNGGQKKTKQSWKEQSTSCMMDLQTGMETM